MSWFYPRGPAFGGPHAPGFGVDHAADGPDAGYEHPPYHRGPPSRGPGGPGRRHHFGPPGGFDGARFPHRPGPPHQPGEGPGPDAVPPPPPPPGPHGDGIPPPPPPPPPGPAGDFPPPPPPPPPGSAGRFPPPPPHPRGRHGHFCPYGAPISPDFFNDLMSYCAHLPWGMPEPHGPHSPPWFGEYAPDWEGPHNDRPHHHGHRHGRSGRRGQRDEETTDTTTRDEKRGEDVLTPSWDSSSSSSSDSDPEEQDIALVDETAGTADTETARNGTPAAAKDDDQRRRDHGPRGAGGRHGRHGRHGPHDRHGPHGGPHGGPHAGFGFGFGGHGHGHGPRGDYFAAGVGPGGPYFHHGRHDRRGPRGGPMGPMGGRPPMHPGMFGPGGPFRPGGPGGPRGPHGFHGHGGPGGPGGPDSRGHGRGPPGPSFEDFIPSALGPLMNAFADHPWAHRMRAMGRAYFDSNAAAPGAESSDESAAARGRGAGIDREEGREGRSTADADFFSPPVDLFHGEHGWVLHAALPGARKEDIGVHWDADRAVLSIAGVVHRPGDEAFLEGLVSSERCVGLFQRDVRLPLFSDEPPPYVPAGSEASAPVLSPTTDAEQPEQPAAKPEKTREEVDADHITARMENGILIVNVPIVEKEWTEVRRVDIL